MKIEVYTPQPQEEPVLRLKLVQYNAGSVHLCECRRDGASGYAIAEITASGIRMCESVNCGLPTDDRGRVRIVP